MAEPALKERLQPALLDRLTDDERSVMLVRITAAVAALDAARLHPETLVQALEKLGLKLLERHADGGELRLRLQAAPGRIGARTLRELRVGTPGVAEPRALGELARIEVEVAPGSARESVERRSLSMRRLRECVHRDLAWLLNSLSLDATVDLSRLPHVQRSVLNFGMPSFAGRDAVSIDRAETARRIRAVIECFEPRLTDVRVRPQERTSASEDGVLAFTIEAQLWGQPLPQQLRLRTSIDVMSGEVSLADAADG